MGRVGPPLLELVGPEAVRLEVLGVLGLDGVELAVRRAVMLFLFVWKCVRETYRGRAYTHIQPPT